MLLSEGTKERDCNQRGIAVWSACGGNAVRMALPGGSPLPNPLFMQTPEEKKVCRHEDTKQDDMLYEKE